MQLWWEGIVCITNNRVIWCPIVSRADVWVFELTLTFATGWVGTTCLVVDISVWSTQEVVKSWQVHVAIMLDTSISESVIHLMVLDASSCMAGWAHGPWILQSKLGDLLLLAMVLSIWAEVVWYHDNIMHRCGRWSKITVIYTIYPILVHLRRIPIPHVLEPLLNLHIA